MDCDGFVVPSVRRWKRSLSRARDIDGDLAAKEAERIVSEGGSAIPLGCDVSKVAAMVDPAARSSAGEPRR